jgi:hypothetical protein
MREIDHRLLIPESAVAAEQQQSITYHSTYTNKTSSPEIFWASSLIRRLCWPSHSLMLVNAGCSYVAIDPI